MIDLKDYGYQTDSPVQAENDGFIPARVTEVHRERYLTVCAYGEVPAKLKAGVYFDCDSGEAYPTTGDFVLLRYNALGDSLIVRTLPRRSFFSRKDPDVGRGEQIVAANFDYVFIMSSLNQDFNLKRIERYLTAGWQSGGVPVVVLTKADLCAEAQDKIRQVERIAPGVSIVVVSAQTGFGMSGLYNYLKPGKTVVFLGSSGVGKSSLVNALAGEEIMRVNGIREDDAKGHHTTTKRQLIRLKSGAMVIDTPGMRELGLWDVSEGLGEAFTDVEALFAQCRFSDCTHKSEPGCAVLAAIENGSLTEARYKSYLQLKREAKFSDAKAAYKSMKQQRNKSIAKSYKQSKLRRGV